MTLRRGLRDLLVCFPAVCRIVRMGEFMSVEMLVDSGLNRTTGVLARAVNSVKTKFDNALVRYDAWFLVFVAVILALGATLLAGMAVWCVVKQHKTFTGSWSFRNFGLKVYFECR